LVDRKDLFRSGGGHGKRTRVRDVADMLKDGDTILLDIQTCKSIH
jgi:hypothetical protein